ncbi:MAG TPA: LysR family transcriptional regulator [Advenella kashmirensis]|uniref:LysR family transcriptional regulator n=1 Tax=Advenella kashmirensis TaxID=310575 RepID=A0A356LN22_9BURK|nr:LysR family transcriptional regulator [Advenella kashmirensis]
MRLTIPELEAVLLVADNLSFRIAAEKANVSQPALSRRIQGAESKLNTTLFDRDKHRVTLTDAGAELVPIATRVISEFQDSLSDLSEFITGRRGVVNIWALPSVAAAILPQAAQTFQQTHPQVRLVVRAASAGQVAQAVSEGIAHMGFSIEQTSSVAGLSFMPLLTDPFVLICPKSDPLASMKIVDWKVFNNRPFVSSGPISSIRHVTDDILAKSVPNAHYVIDNISVVGAMVAAGAGIAAVPKLALRLMDTSQLQSVPLRSPAATREIGILSRKNKSLPAAATHFYNLVKDSWKGRDVK